MVTSKRVLCAHVVMALAPMAAAACGQETHGPRDVRGGAASADCVILLRLGGETFREVAYGAARDKGAVLGDAQQSSCEDIGRNARGAYFAEDAPVVRAWAVRGQDPAGVIATVGSDGRIALYVADDLSDRQQERLTTRLSVAD